MHGSASFGPLGPQSLHFQLTVEPLAQLLCNRNFRHLLSFHYSHTLLSVSITVFSSDGHTWLFLVGTRLHIDTIAESLICFLQLLKLSHVDRFLGRLVLFSENVFKEQILIACLRLIERCLTNLRVALLK